METAKTDKHSDLKRRAAEEFRAYLVIVVYLWVVLGCFTVYRRLILAETGVSYLHYGFALIEALIIGKVVLIGRAFGIDKRFEDHALIVPVLYKSAVFGAFVLAFGVLEHIVGGWFHHKGLIGGLTEIRTLGAYELAARVLMMVAAFIPFFAFSEMGRIMGVDRLRAMFFSRPQDQSAPTG
jgi:hypothetical protein